MCDKNCKKPLDKIYKDSLVCRFVVGICQIPSPFLSANFRPPSSLSANVSQTPYPPRFRPWHSLWMTINDKIKDDCFVYVITKATCDVLTHFEDKRAFHNETPKLKLNILQSYFSFNK